MNDQLSRIIQQFQTLHKIKLKPSWIMRNSLENASVSILYQRFLGSDITESAEPCLPPNAHTFHDTVLKGSYVLQVKEIYDVKYSANVMYEAIREKVEGISRRGRLISDSTANENTNNDSNDLPLPRGMVRLCMTDGVQIIIGMEYTDLKSIAIDSPLGIKIVIKDAKIRRGVFLLTPDCFNILGGQIVWMNEGRIWNGLLLQYASLAKIPDNQLPIQVRQITQVRPNLPLSTPLSNVIINTSTITSETLVNNDVHILDHEIPPEFLDDDINMDEHDDITFLDPGEIFSDIDLAEIQDQEYDDIEKGTNMGNAIYIDEDDEQ